MNTQTPGSMPADITAQLASLHDIHLPDPVAWWPLAPGWWALASLALVAIVCIIFVRHQRRRSLKQAALRELAMLEKTCGDTGSVQALATEVNVLIRRVALSLPDGKQYAHVYGQRWSDYLAALPTGMPESMAHLLAVAPYAEPDTILPSGMPGNDAGDPVSKSAIIAEARIWIRRHA